MTPSGGRECRDGGTHAVGDCGAAGTGHTRAGRMHRRDGGCRLAPEGRGPGMPPEGTAR